MQRLKLKNANQQYSITGALNQQITQDVYYNRHDVTEVAERVDTAIAKLGDVLQLLHNKGVISNDELLKLLPDFELGGIDI